MVDLLNPEAHSAALSWIAAADAETWPDDVQIDSVDFGGKLAVVLLTDGTEHLVLVDVNDREVSFDAFRGDPATVAWLNACGVSEELEERWMARKWEG